MTSVSRRQFVLRAALAAAASGAEAGGAAFPGRALGEAPGESPGSDPSQDPRNDRQPWRELAYSQVRLTAGPFHEHHSRIHQQYLSLSSDSLLQVYRERAGLPAPGARMGGWYGLDGFVPGHSLGQYISGLARIGANTGDAACYDKVRELTSGFGATLGPENQSILRPATNLWICYTLDKHFAGLIDAATLGGLPQAAELLPRVLAGARPLLPAVGRDRIGKKDPPYDETYVMPENLFAAARLTGEPAFGELARRYLLDREFFDPLAAGADPLPGQHAYSHAIALSSGAAAYLALGDAKYKRALENAFTLLTTQQQFASGGWGPNETFIAPHQGELFASLSTTTDHFETPCGAYAASKLARYLLRLTARPEDTRHGDNLERVLFNTILAARDPDSSGHFFYYSTYSASAAKVYYPKKWPCCSGTLVQTVADYPLNLYFVSADPARPALYVNLYTPSEARLSLAGAPLRIAQETLFPAEDTIRLRLQPDRPARFTLVLRIPSWTARPAAVFVNGRSAGTAPAGGFVRLDRTWRAGDAVSLTLPQDFRTEPIDELHPETAALLRGPLQYVALNRSPDTAEDRLPPLASLRPIGGASQAFAAGAGERRTVYIPLYRVRNENYTSYFTRA